MHNALKPKTCRMCKASFIPVRPLMRVCGPLCAMDFARSTNERKARKEQAQDKRETRAKIKEKKQDLGWWLAKCKVTIQTFRRLEELAKGSGCMSCGRSQQEITAGPWRPGGYFDGGHFLGKGAFPELALEPLNIWLQCKSCNAGSGKYSRKGHTVNQSFEKNLIATIGQEQVDWLKGPHPLKHYTIDELKAFDALYVAKTKELAA